jgi:hypothetical protein
LQRALNIYFITRLKGGIYMAIVQVADFGEYDGVRTYRVNGDKVDLERIIADCRKEDTNCFDGEPELEKTLRHWTLLIRLKVAVQVGDEG